MQKVSGEASPMTRLQPGGACPRGQRHQGPLGILHHDHGAAAYGVPGDGPGHRRHRDSAASAFNAMERSVSAQLAAMEEQWWLMDAEVMYCAVVEGFVREINVELTKRDRYMKDKDVRCLHCVIAEVLLRKPWTNSNL